MKIFVRLIMILVFSVLVYFLYNCFGGIDPSKRVESIVTSTTLGTTTTTATTTTCEAPRSDSWYRCFAEYSNAPQLQEGNRQYYPCVIYDSNAFNSTTNDYVNGVSGSKYSVKPYYKMYVGQNTTFYSTEFLYSEDGMTWIHPTEGINLISGSYHPMVLYKNDNFEDGHKYKMWNWNATTNDKVKYYYSDDGINFTNNTSGDIDNTKYLNTSVIYSCYVIRKGTNNYIGWFDNNGTIFSSTSTDAITWSTGQVCTNATTGNTISTTNGSLSVYVNSSNKYCIWFSSLVDGTLDLSGTAYKGISYAESTDGISWTMLNNLSNMGGKTNPLFGTTDGNTWRTGYTYTPWVVYSPTQFDGHGLIRDYKMWFTGGISSGSRRIGFASFSKP